MTTARSTPVQSEREVRGAVPLGGAIGRVTVREGGAIGQVTARGWINVRGRAGIAHRRAWMIQPSVTGKHALCFSLAH